MNPAADLAARAYQRASREHRRAIVYAPDATGTPSHEHALAILGRASLAEIVDPAPELAYPASPEWPRPFVPLPDGTIALDSRLWSPPMG